MWNITFCHSQAVLTVFVPSFVRFQFWRFLICDNNKTQGCLCGVLSSSKLRRISSIRSPQINPVLNPRIILVAWAAINLLFLCCHVVFNLLTCLQIK